MDHWLAQMRESGDLAKEMTTGIPKALADPNLTADQVNRLFASVDTHCRSVERLIADMEAHDADDSLLEAAEALDELWGTLAEAVVQRMMEMRGV